jgi:hypothetical protein
VIKEIRGVLLGSSVCSTITSFSGKNILQFPGFERSILVHVMFSAAVKYDVFCLIMED